MGYALKADCTRCCGLCCVAPPFDTGQGFGYDKPAHRPCANLLPDDRCAIHPMLAESGFPGCSCFDCHGAGQRITQEFFPGEHWRDSPETARRMFDGYSRLLRLHELMALVDWAMAASPDADRGLLAAQRLRLDRASAEVVDGSGAVRLPLLRNETLTLLREQVKR